MRLLREKWILAISSLVFYALTSFGWVSITDTSGPRAPLALPQSINVSYQSAIAVTLSGSPSTSGDVLKYSIITSPTHGTLNGTLPNLTYTPKTGYYGSDSFTFTVSVGALTSKVATVNIMVAELQIILTYAASGSPYSKGLGKIKQILAVRRALR